MDPDTLKAISTAGAALVGAIVGSSTTVFLQRRAVGFEREKLGHTSRGRVNALSVAVFREFLWAAKEVERLAERARNSELLTHDEIQQATSQMSLRWQEVLVFCDPAIGARGDGFVTALYQVVWFPDQDMEVSKRLAEPRNSLFAVAGPIFREA